jgi:hypothetical protein
MKRTDLLKSLAKLPLLGVLLTSTHVGQWEPGESEAAADGVEHVFAGLTPFGRYFTVRGYGWPTLQEIKDFALTGFDRLEIWEKGRVIYQDTTWPGRIPAGWQSLEHAGFLR